MKTIQTSLKTMGKWVKTKMLQLSCKFTILATQICDFSSEMLQIACKIRYFSSKTQQIARKSERFKLQNAANSTHIRDCGSKMQQITQVRDFSIKNVANSKENCPRLKKKKSSPNRNSWYFFGNGMVRSLSSYTNKKTQKNIYTWMNLIMTSNRDVTGMMRLE